MDGAVPFKEVDDSKKMAVIANVGCFLIMLILAIPALIRCRGYLADLSIQIMLGGISSMLIMFPHEILHAICFKEDVYLYTNMKQGMLFVVGTETMSKGRFIFMSLLPNIVFVYSTKEHLEQVFKEDKRLSHYHFYRDKTKKINQFDDKHPPVVVSHCEMLNFIKLTNVKSEHVKLVKPEHCHYKSGDKVRIVNGEFSGVEGRVARISGQQRVVVEMEGVCMVATAYIPSAFLLII